MPSGATISSTEPRAEHRRRAHDNEQGDIVGKRDGQLGVERGSGEQARRPVRGAVLAMGPGVQYEPHTRDIEMVVESHPRRRCRSGRPAQAGGRSAGLRPARGAVPVLGNSVGTSASSWASGVPGVANASGVLPRGLEQHVGEEGVPDHGPPQGRP